MKNSPGQSASRLRWILAGSVLGSTAVFVEGSVVTVALPSIGRDFGLGVAGLQWVMNGYLLTLSALMLLGGALGDRFSRSRVFALGLLGFAIASVGCALAPTVPLLLAARVVQGIAGAVAVPNSLAMLEAEFSGEARGAAIGQWAGWSAVSTAIGPLVGGAIVDTTSWRLVFAVVAPLALAASWTAWRHGAPASSEPGPKARIDYAGAALATIGLGGVVGALTNAPSAGYTSVAGGGPLVVGILALVAFAIVETRAAAPLVSLELFRFRQFTGANLATLFIYAALSGLFFVLMLDLQNVHGFSALAAGASLLPINALMLLLSSRAGRLAARIGARIPMTVGPIVAAAGMVMFTRAAFDGSYLTTLLPATIVFGLGLSITVAPLTAAVLAAAGASRAGVASAVNNAVARVAGLLATAALPAAAGFAALRYPSGAPLAHGFVRAMWICAALCAAGGLVAFATIRVQPPDAGGER